jgi:hypothetical protein
MFVAHRVVSKALSFATTATTATAIRTSIGRVSLDAAARRRRFWQFRLPLILLGCLVFSGLVTIFLRAGQYGITVDEPLRESVGSSIVSWYSTLGRDTSYLTGFPPDLHEPEHGGIFDAFVTVLQFHVFPSSDHWYVRHVVTALVGLLGVVALALCGYELGGAWVAFVAGLGLWLYPRYYGAIYNNPKDVPAAVTMAFLLWATLIFVKQWNTGKHSLRNGLLVGVTLGVAIAIRVNAILWVAILALLLAGWWLYHGRQVWHEKLVSVEVRRQATATAVIGVSSLLTTMALWPYILINPLVNLYRSIEVLSHYPFDEGVLYNGVVYPATQLPRDYAPVWLVIGSPPTLLLLALLGVGLFAFSAFRTRRIDGQLAATFLAFAVPWSAILVLHSVIYDGLRHFLFLIPPLILFAAWGLVRAVTVLTRRAQSALAGRQQLILRVAAVGLVLLTLGSYALVAQDMIKLSPYEYTYFSPVVGGLPGANGRFDTDYWATCSEASAQWLSQHYQEYTSAPYPTIVNPYSKELVSVYLPQSFVVFLPAVVQKDHARPDFYISPTRGNNDQLFPDYKVIHVVSVQTVPLCVVKVNPDTVSP